jgi:hypothetical protein
VLRCDGSPADRSYLTDAWTGWAQTGLVK